MSYLTDHCSCPQPPSLVPSTGQNTFSKFNTNICYCMPLVRFLKERVFSVLDANIYSAILIFVGHKLDENEREFIKYIHLVKLLKTQNLHWSIMNILGTKLIMVNIPSMILKAIEAYNIFFMFVFI